MVIAVRPDSSGGTDVAIPEIGRLKRFLAVICDHCPICNHGREHPESWIGRALHHPVHADHCPFWKAEQEVRGAGGDGPG
jgi:hypothetical protein